MNKGILFAVGAYLTWGFLPIFWKLLQAVPSIELLAHRIAWALVLLFLYLAYTRHFGWMKSAIRDRRIVLTFVATALLLSLNWGTYIWAVNSGFIVETSLGYFINPLVSVSLGVFFLQERLRHTQWLAVALAGCGVLYLTIALQAVPWISLILAFSFAFYGLLRKTATLEAIEGLTAEMSVAFIPAFGYLLFLGVSGAGSFGRVDFGTNVLLVLTGLITVIPLAWFSMGARRIPLSTIGLLQYIAPTFQFLIGVFVYDEPFSTTQFIGFSIVWLALALYSLEGVWFARRKSVVPAVAGD